MTLYKVELPRIDIRTPPLDSVDNETRRVLTTYPATLTGGRVYEQRERFRNVVDIRMPEIERNYELPIWQAFLPMAQMLHDDDIGPHMKVVPRKVFNRYMRIRACGAFSSIELWYRERQPLYWLLVGYHRAGYFILAMWQIDTSRQIDFSLVKQWIRQGLYPEQDFLEGAEIPITDIRKQYTTLCDSHDQLLQIVPRA